MHCKLSPGQAAKLLVLPPVQGIVNRDIKLENTLLDGSRRPLLKICDFGYSKHEKDSLPKSKVGTPGYTGAPPAASHSVTTTLLHRTLSMGSWRLLQLASAGTWNHEKPTCRPDQHSRPCGLVASQLRR